MHASLRGGPLQFLHAHADTQLKSRHACITKGWSITVPLALESHLEHVHEINKKNGSWRKLAGQQPQAHLFSHALESEQCTPTPNGPGPSVQAVERVEPPCALRIRNLHVLPHFVFLRLMRLGVFGCAVFCDHMCVQRSPSVGPACIAQSFSSGNPFSSGVDTNAELPLSLYASGEDARRRGHM